MAGLKVLLYRPPARFHTSIFPQKTLPMGLLSIAGTLRSHGFPEIRLIDGFEGSGLDDLVRQAQDWQPDVVGISGLTAHAYDAMVAAQVVRESAPGALVVAGGIHFSAVPDETLRVCPHFDAVAIGEGEQTFLELCRALPSAPRHADWRDLLQDVAGLCWLTPGSDPPLDALGQVNPDRQLVYTEMRALMMDLGELSMPAFDLARPDRYRMRPYPWSDFMSLEASRGCPFQCTFCHTTQFWKKRWRPRPIEAVLDEVEYSVTHLGRRAIHFTDDSWATRRDRVIEFCEGILSRGLDVELWAQCRVDDLHRDRDLFGLMRRAGFYGFLVGFESGEQTDLDRWKKGVDVDRARELAPALTEHFDSIIGTFVIGDWDTTQASFDATRAFSREVGVDIFLESHLSLFPPTIPLWKAYEARGIDMEWDYDQIGNCKVILPTSTLSSEEVGDLQKRNMVGFYTDPKKAWHALSSGKHAARQFSSILLSGLQDVVRERTRSVVPAQWRGRAQTLREEYRQRHLAHAAVRPMPVFEPDAWDGTTRPSA